MYYEDDLVLSSTHKDSELVHPDGCFGFIIFPRIPAATEQWSRLCIKSVDGSILGLSQQNES
jgi:hypothetical protein